MNTSTLKSAFLGYGFAALTGKIIYHLNEVFVPEYATRGRLIAWVLLIGTFFTIMLQLRDKK